MKRFLVIDTSQIRLNAKDTIPVVVKELRRQRRKARQHELRGYGRAHFPPRPRRPHAGHRV